MVNMKNRLLIAAAVACALSAPVVFAQDKHSHPAPAVDTEKPVSQMAEKMKAMQLQMDAIHATTDPQARQKLMQEHMQAMQESMKEMHGMGGPAMKGGMPMDAKKGEMKKGEMMQHHAMI